MPSFFHPTYIQPKRENGLSGQAGLGMHDWSLSASHPREYHLQTTRGSKLSKGEERQPETVSKRSLTGEVKIGLDKPATPPSFDLRCYQTLSPSSCVTQP